MRTLDLFSGIGGFALGLEPAGFIPVAFCEFDPYCRAVLAKHWPHVPCYPDIRELNAASLRLAGIGVECITGGFPCQDISAIGAGAGITGARSGLWSEFARLIGELRPHYVIVENVPSLLNRGISRVLGDLAAIGYDAEWHCIPASAVGARHVRDRVFIIAYEANVLHPGCELLEGRAPVASTEWPPEPVMGGMADGLPHRVDRLRALGNAVVPQVVTLIGHAIMRHAHDH